MAPTAGEGVLFQYGTGVKDHGLTEDNIRQLKQPRGVCIGRDGSLLVADFDSHCVVKFGQNDARGKVVAGESGKILPTVDILKDIDRPLGPAEGEGLLMKRPIDVCPHAEGGLLILDNEVCRLQHYAAPGEKAATIVPPPSGPPQKSVNNPESVKYPRSMLARPDGTMVICDTWSHRVLSYAPGASTAEVIAGKSNSSAITPEQMTFPSGIAFDSEGRLYVTDTNNNRVQCFQPGSAEGAAGTTVCGSAEGVAGAGLHELDMPTGVCIDHRDGSLLVVDRMNGRVMRYPAGGGKQGEVVAGPKQQLVRPWGICQDHLGALYISDERKYMVLKVKAPKPLASPAAGYPIQQALPVPEKFEPEPRAAAPKPAAAPEKTGIQKQADALKQQMAEANQAGKDVSLPTDAAKDLHPLSHDHDALD